MIREKMINFLRCFMKGRDRWSIGIYTGDSPYHVYPPENIKNPVLTARDVTDRRAEFVADPFMVKEQGIWYMFFEVFNQSRQKGEIGLAISNDGFHWVYQKIILTEPFHLSYPCVFRWENAYYMIPESSEKKAIRLYKAIHFPGKWEFIKDLITGSDFLDSSIFYYRNLWWLFTCPSTQYDILKLFYANDIEGPWIEHPANPIVTRNPHIARCGGRALVWKDKIVRYAQDDYPIYGCCLNAFEITKLSTSDYEERKYSQNPILRGSGKMWSWNRDGMHTLDPHFLEGDRWIACVDGNIRYRRLRRKR